jgi:hypothetical protein
MTVRSSGVLGLVLGGLAAVSGCSRTFQSSVVQPNPLSQPLETLRESEELIIVMGDMELNVPREGKNLPQEGSIAGGSVMADQRYPLVNTARFTVISRDRLRFHVRLEHKWEEWTELSGWEAYLEDDQGHKYDPQEVDQRSDRHIVKMWDYEQRSAVRDRYQDIVYVNNDGYKRRQTLGSLSVFRGQGDLVFFHRNIFNPKIKWITLHLKRQGTNFEFKWRFADEPRVALGRSDK